MKALDPATMAGLVILIPVANPPAFQAMRRVNPSPDDLMDFGEAFPGSSVSRPSVSPRNTCRCGRNMRTSWSISTRVATASFNTRL